MFSSSSRNFSSLAPAVALCLLAAMLPGEAMAQENIANVLCGIASWVYGPIGKAIGAIGVISLGLAAMVGRIQISAVLITLCGIITIFSAQNLVDIFGLNFNCPPGGIPGVNIEKSDIASALGCLIGMAQGAPGKAIATIAVIFLGLTAQFGRISYHQAIVTAIGMATIFGAMEIVDEIAVTSGNGGTATIPINALCT